MAAAAPVQNSLKPGKWFRSTCKMCLHSCTSLVHVTDEGVVNKVEGDPTNPSNNGKLCPKGNSAIMRHYDPNRFKTPLRRTNPEKGPGIDPKWEPIAWDEALDIVGRELKQSLDDDPRKILPSITDFQKIGLWGWSQCFGNFNFFGSGGAFCGGAYHPMNGYIHSTFASINDVHHCNLWINHGTGDGFSSHLHAAALSYWVGKARSERNMKVVTIEPRLSISAAKSEQWIPIRPATDRQFALGLCHVMINEKLCDYDSLRKDTNAPYLVGPDGYFVRDKKDKIYIWDEENDCAKLWDDTSVGKMALEGTYQVNGVECKPGFQKFKDILDDCTPEQIEEITTVPADTIRQLARDFAKAAQVGSYIEIDGRKLPLRPAGYNYYRGAQAHKLGMQANHAYKLVNMLMGTIDTPGGHIGLTLQDQQEDNGHVELGENGMLKPNPHQLGPMPGFSFPPNEGHLVGYFPVGVHPPHLYMETFANPEKYGIDYKPDTMLLLHSNPLWSLTGRRDLMYALVKSLRFIVAIDIVPNESNEWADIILPSHDMLESWNMTMIEPPVTEGMCMRQPVTEPLYDTKSEEEILYEISERMGILEDYNKVLNGGLGFHQKPELLLDLDKKYSDKEIAERMGKLWNGKDLDWYVEHGHSVKLWRPDKTYRPWEGMRLHFYIEDMLTQRDGLRAKMEAANVPLRHEWDFDDYQPLPTVNPDPVLLEPAEYDLFGISFKDIQLNFGESLSNPWIRDIVFNDPVHTALLLNAKTAVEQGLENGDIVKVESAYGAIYGRIGTTEGIHPETLGISNSLSRMASQDKAVPFGGGNFNNLLPYDLKNTDAASGQAEGVCKLKLTKLSAWPDHLRNNTAYNKRSNGGSR